MNKFFVIFLRFLCKFVYAVLCLVYALIILLKAVTGKGIQHTKMGFIIPDDFYLQIFGLM